MIMQDTIPTQYDHIDFGDLSFYLISVMWLDKYKKAIYNFYFMDEIGPTNSAVVSISYTDVIPLYKMAIIFNSDNDFDMRIEHLDGLHADDVIALLKNLLPKPKTNRPYKYYSRKK